MHKGVDFIHNFPGLVIEKDAESNYLHISHEFAKLLGWKSAFECPGKTDYDIPCKAVEFADQFIEMDKKAIAAGVKMLALDIQNYAHGWKIILVERGPTQDAEGKPTGLFNHCIDVSDASLFKSYLALRQTDNKILGKTHKPVSYILSNPYNPLPLTEKQQNCLFFLIRGKSIKEIAQILQVSPRTVECHIDAIKNKLACQYKSEIIEKAIENDFLYYIPKDIQQKINAIF